VRVQPVGAGPFGDEAVVEAPLIWIVALAGLRPAEAFGLTIDRVRFPERSLWIEQQVQHGVEVETLKTRGSYADLPVDQLLLDKIASHWTRFRAPVTAATAARRARRGLQPPPTSRLLVLNRCGRPVLSNAQDLWIGSPGVREGRTFPGD
jgi:hypothetical protein